MITVNLFDNEFSHCRFSTGDVPLGPLQWRPCNSAKPDTLVGPTVFTDGFFFGEMPTLVKARPKIGWLAESREIRPYQMEDVLRVHRRFDLVLTHDHEILTTCRNSRFCVPATPRMIDRADVKLYPKTKLVNGFISNKAMTPGHRFRLGVLDRFQNRVDWWGRGIKEVPYDKKGEVCRDYMFQVVMENARYDYHFTEKILDAFYVGAVPVYWGCPSIGKFFDVEGILPFETADDLDDLLTGLSADVYESKQEAVKANLEKALQYYAGAERFILEHLVAL